MIIAAYARADDQSRTSLRPMALGIGAPDAGARESGPWSMAAFAPPALTVPTAAAAPMSATASMPTVEPTSAPAPAPAPAPPPTTRNVFEGRLQLTQMTSPGRFEVLVDLYGDSNAHNGAARHLPPFDFEFVQSGNVLIPVRRGAIPSRHPAWEFILEPGSVWDEATDEGYTRASLPFTLEERNANCMHNGVLTFLFRNDGAVSKVAFEISKETCRYFHFNWWGYAQAHYTAQSIPQRDAVIARYAEESSARLPMRPISALAADFPGARPDRFGSPLEIPPQSLTTYGLVIDGIHYTGECATRFGTYPYCEVMDLPSYSLSKSMVGAMAMMHLAVAYPNIPGERIADWVPSCAKRDWQGVTFKDALSMATGHYRSPVYEEDENGPDMAAFFIADTHAAKLEFACSHYPRRAPPGEQWVYHTSDSYLLGTALGAFYRSVKGATADFYSDIFVDSLWRQLHLSPVLDVPRRTYDAARQPFTGYGLTLHRDDVAKIGVFLNVDHGRNSDGQGLDAGLLNAALQRDPDAPGLRAGKDELRYNLGFWAWNAQRALKCSQPAWIPFMSGYGGILVALLPNGMIYYYFSDGGVYLSALGIAEANRIRPICGS